MRDSKAVRYVLATFLLFIATLSGAGACALNLCKSECPMHQPVKAAATHSCCNEKGPEKTQEPKCGCVIKGSPVVNKAPQPPVIGAPAAELLAPDLFVPSTNLVEVPVCETAWLVLTHPPTGPPPDEHGSRAPPLQ